MARLIKDIKCPECKEAMGLDVEGANIEDGDVIECTECGTEFDIISINEDGPQLMYHEDEEEEEEEEEGEE